MQTLSPVHNDAMLTLADLHKQGRISHGEKVILERAILNPEALQPGKIAHLMPGESIGPNRIRAPA